MGWRSPVSSRDSVLSESPDRSASAASVNPRALLIPALRGVLRLAPAVGSEAWHLVVRHRRTGQRLAAAGLGQSEATGRLAALTAVRAAHATPSGVVTMHDLLRLDEALAALQP
ncbi:hypothetical protein GCM10009847_18540 [Leucobacter tardus]|uniref:Uncharacterized protein n=1 Tax=Leucobacter tardus TaxID=501483 RepID=A0A939QG69_9MICO|nr:hypothetical protein [Leucobacter tardus]MBO2990633.1 hypothetical protein [Leucobacter tardus]